MNVNTPLVTVIAVCYNHSRFVINCLDSIRSQTYQNIQLIIMDDCSTDNSVSLIQKWISSNNVSCIFISHKINKGFCKTLNEALSYAKGKYVAMIATDDVWMMDKIERQVAIMEQQSEDVGVLYSDAFQIDEDGNLLPKMFIETYRSFSKMPQGYIFNLLVDQNFIPAMTTLVRKSVYDKVGLYDERLIFEDKDMWLRVSKHYKFVFSPYVSAKYRIVSTSLARTIFSNRNSSLYVSLILIKHKLLVDGCLSQQQSVKLRHELIQAAKKLYRLGYKNASTYLWVAFKHKPNLNMFGSLIFCVCRIPYSLVEKFNRFRSRLFSYLLWQHSPFGGRSKQ